MIIFYFELYGIFFIKRGFSLPKVKLYLISCYYILNYIFSSEINPLCYNPIALYFLFSEALVIGVIFSVKLFYKTHIYLNMV